LKIPLFWGVPGPRLFDLFLPLHAQIHEFEKEIYPAFSCAVFFSFRSFPKRKKRKGPM